jgi:hypothetical protein
MAANANTLTQKTGEASAKPEDRGGAGVPKTGDRFHCEERDVKWHRDGTARWEHWPTKDEMGDLDESSRN